MCAKQRRLFVNIGVTGGNGKVGRHLVPYLLEQNHHVVVMDCTPSTNSLQAAEYLVVDMRDYNKVINALHGCDALIHLAAYTPLTHPDAVVYSNNTTISYNALSVAAKLGIRRVCLASSANAVGGEYSRVPRYDYFPIDEQHPTYVEDPYGLSKRVLEQQADAFARRYPMMRIASLRFHLLVESRECAMLEQKSAQLWAYTLLREASRACLLALTADFTGHEVFFITAPRTAANTPSLDLARKYYPLSEVRGNLTGHTAFYSSAKAERLLRWKHER
jgi:UDP-glucose 4-epimerase